MAGVIVVIERSDVMPALSAGHKPQNAANGSETHPPGKAVKPAHRDAASWPDIGSQKALARTIIQFDQIDPGCARVLASLAPRLKATTCLRWRGCGTPQAELDVDLLIYSVLRAPVRRRPLRGSSMNYGFVDDTVLDGLIVLGANLSSYAVGDGAAGRGASAFPTSRRWWWVARWRLAVR